MTKFKLGTREIGVDKPTYIIAEIGANHNGEIQIAKKSIDAAKECGVDAVKFQTYTAKELIADLDRLVTMGPKGNQVTERIEDMFNKVTLKREAHSEVFNYAREVGLEVFSTPFSLDGVNFLNNLDVNCFKIAASDIDYLDLLKEIAKTNKLVMLSLGKCTIGEADMAITTLEENGCEKLVIMHCVSQYPSRIEDMNLKVITSLKNLYPEHIIGFSDHSMGNTAALGAVALGARVIEKHFTIDKKLSGPDHWFSMDPFEMKSLVTEVRNLETAMGSSRKKILRCEESGRYNSIRSLVINKDLKCGDKIREEDLIALRPGYGIKPYDKEKIIGMKVQRDIKKLTVLTWDVFK